MAILLICLSYLDCYAPPKPFTEVIVDFNYTMRDIIQIIKKGEGISLKAIQCPAQKKRMDSTSWTIGYGHVYKGTGREIIDNKEADRLLYQDLMKIDKAISSDKVKLTNNQRLAITLFVYAVGYGNYKKSLYKKILSDTVTEQDFTRWSKINGVTYPSLIVRHKLEYKIFNTKPYTITV